MSDLNAVRISVHQNNINRYRRLLRTKLTEIELQYVARRLAEERQSLDFLVARQSHVRQRVPASGPRARLSDDRSLAERSTVIAAASMAQAQIGPSHSPD